jgi:hypothetical protein
MRACDLRINNKKLRNLRFTDSLPEKIADLLTLKKGLLAHLCIYKI